MLVSKSEFIIREAKFQFKNLGILWSGGKDSTVVIHLARNSFPNMVFEQMPIIQLATGFKFKQTADYIDKMADEWNLSNQLFRAKYYDENAPVYDKDGKFECCTARKTDNLRKALKEIDVDAVLVGIRRDEQEIRNKERFFSPRDTEGRWDYWNQPIEMQGWDLFVEANPTDKHHMRVHPLLEWSEEDVWQYVKAHDIPMNPIYFSKNGKRYRSVGCEPCTSPMDSNASTIDEIIKEVQESRETERAGRTQDKEADMNRLRALGYM